MMERAKNVLPIRSIIVIIFLVALLLSSSLIAFFMVKNWIASAEHSTGQILKTVTETIDHELNSLMDMPMHVNEVGHGIFQKGILDLKDEKKRDQYFVGILMAQEKSLYSFSYGTEEGFYYGARRNDNGVIEIMRNETSTGGQSWYYAVQEDLSAGERVVQAGPFDPRTRAWYKAAAAARGPVFSPIYKHFVMDDLTISAAWPVYDQAGRLEGVLGAHMLLADIGSFLKDSMEEFGGYAFLLEKETGALIANSMGRDNFTLSQDGAMERIAIEQMADPNILEPYQKYRENQQNTFVYAGKQGKIFINVREIQRGGLDWLLFSAVPEALYMSSVTRSIGLTLLLIPLAILLAVLLYYHITNAYMKPINVLLQASEALAEGDFSQRVEITRRDEIGIISESFNHAASELQSLVANLEKAVEARTQDLQRAKDELEENHDQLKLILDSTSEAIYGIDLQGNCTFSNSSCIQMLGYSREEELLGKNMHELIHHSHRDGRPFLSGHCKIYQAIQEGRSFQADDEVFWKKDGTFIEVEYRINPKFREGRLIGGVISFMDITDRKQREEEIHYLSSHDLLTGLINRRAFEAQRAILDVENNLPLAVLFADLNGLKMTNDIFGHQAGDQLIQKAAEVLSESCRKEDVVARIGGDEFVMLLPKTDKDQAKLVMERIETGLAQARVHAIKCSLSLGLDLKKSPYQSLEEVMANAENAMYKNKTMTRKAINAEMVQAIVESLHAQSPREKEHSIEVSRLSLGMGAAMELSIAEMTKLGRAAFLHDIGKVVVDQKILTKELLTEEEYEVMRQHPVAGFRILNLFDETLDLAEPVYGHHERWDGKGYPRGIQGESIPRISRIISVAETYERVFNREEGTERERKAKALEVIRQGRGSQFDPDIADVLIRLMEEKIESKGKMDQESI